MDDYTKRIHECFKRTLIFESGKKIRPVAICFANSYYLQESTCNGAHPASEEEVRQDREEYLYLPGGDTRCVSCPLLKKGNYISDIVKMLKTFGVFNAQDDTESSRSRRDYFTNTCIEYFLLPLLDRVKTRCYLTFVDKDRKYVYDKIVRMSFDELIKLLDNIDAFIKENNIK